MQITSRERAHAQAKHPCPAAGRRVLIALCFAPLPNWLVKGTQTIRIASGTPYGRPLPRALGLHMDTPSYTNGLPISKGDHVFIASEQVHAVVHELIQSVAQQAEWDVLAPGVMFQAKEFGLLFMSNEILKECPLDQPSI